MIKWTTKIFTQLIILTYICTFVVILVLGSAFLLGQKNITQSHKERYDSYVIADELRQSSDDLTKFVRMYAATGDTYFKDLYFEVLMIRNGELSRPINYEKIYWDLLLPEHLKSDSTTQPKALVERMKSHGFTTEELDLLSLAEDNSNELVNLELLAMRAIEDKLSAEDKSLLLENESRFEFALRILNDQPYNVAKSAIMGPIKQFYEMFDTRTNNQVNRALENQRIYSALMVLILLILLIILVILYVKLFSKFKENETILEKKVQDRTREITEKNRILLEAKEQLVQSEKMASLGKLVAGVSHEINTPIGIAVTIASHITDITKDKNDLMTEGKLSKTALINYFDEMGKSSKLILNSMNKANELIRSFKQVAVDQSVDESREVNLKEYVDEILLSLHNKLKNTSHTIKFECRDDIIITTHPGALYQIMTNLIFNSLIHGFHSINSGLITIIMSEEDNHITLEYNDNGEGIANENLDKIFEPFFTTRRDGGGCGLGLNIVYNLVTQKLNGSIKCTSTLGNGVYFKIDIPKSNLEVKNEQ
ncbi:MAG: HAMP domain-containing histidine kinase [Clostridiales bacterium]|nr:HAMP domain-containing histidine kinase [Clostridiales bacterium]